MLFWGIIILVILVQIIILMYGKITDLQDKNAVLQREKDFLSSGATPCSSVTETLENLKKEISSAFPPLQDYLASAFSWMSQEAVNNQVAILSASKQKNVPIQAVLCALLFFQVSEQLKFKVPISDPAEMKKLHKYLFDKLSAYHYFTYEPAARNQ